MPTFYADYLFSLLILHLWLFRHVFEECCAVDVARSSAGIADFLDACSAAGVPRALRYSMFLNGLNPDGSELALGDYLQRGSALLELQASWLAV